MSGLHAARCALCRSFQASSQDIEAQLPGLRILSSAFASVRAGDGLCARHERYVSATSACEAFEAADRTLTAVRTIGSSAESSPGCQPA